MYQTKSGKKYGSAFVGKKKDEMDSAPKAGESDMNLNKPKAASEPKEESRTGVTGEAKFSKANAQAPDNNVEGQNLGEGPEGPAQVVAQHGPAHTVTVHHDHANKKHKVVSHHGGGFMHESDHGSPEEAHNAGKQLGGGDQEQSESGTGQSEPSEDGFAMPSL